jgi:hypothetical protein
MNSFIRQIVSLTSSAVLVLALSVRPSAADEDTANAIAGIIALGVLGAAVAHHQHDRGYEDYKRHPKLHPDENAVGNCMHRGKKELKRAGGYRLDLNHVDSVRAHSDGSTHVSMVVTGYYAAGHKTSDVNCVVKNHKITSFKYN